MKTKKMLIFALAVTIILSCLSVSGIFVFAEDVEGLKASAWSFDGANYETLFGNGVNGTNGEKVKETMSGDLSGFEQKVTDEVTTVNNKYALGDNYIVKYTGVITVSESGWYQLRSRFVDNGYVAFIGGVKAFDFCAKSAWMDDGSQNHWFGENLYLEAGKAYSYEAYFIEQDGGEALDIKVSKNGGEVKSFEENGVKFYADRSADNVAPKRIDGADKVIFTFAGVNGRNDNASNVKDFESGSFKIDKAATGHLWNYTTHKYEADTVIKVAYYITVDEIDSSIDENGAAVRFDNNFFMEGKGSLEIPNSVFTENVGKKIIVVGAFNIPNTGMEGRLSLSGGIGFTCDKVVVTTGDYNFMSDDALIGGYTLAFEEGADDDDVDFTPSKKDDGTVTEPDRNPGNPDDDPEKPSQTGDVTAMAAIIVAGVAGIAGLKLRKKSK